MRVYAHKSAELRRETAFNIAIAGWIPCGMFFACAAFTLARNEDAMQARLRNKVVLQPVSATDEADAEILVSSPPPRDGSMDVPRTEL